MNQLEVAKWCDEMIEAWKQVNFAKILEIFSQVECYYEDPFSEPGCSPEEIKSFWEEIQFQNIHKLEMTPIAIEGDTVIIRWFLDYTDSRTAGTSVMDGIYYIEFNPAKKCRKFIQWWVMKE